MPSLNREVKLAMAELGNLTARIVLPLGRKSTVKIGAGSLFRTPFARIGATRAAFGDVRGKVFLRPPQDTALRSQDVHRLAAVSGLRESAPPGAKSKRRIGFEDDWFRRWKARRSEAVSAAKAPADLCPLCEGTGWKTCRLPATARTIAESRAVIASCGRADNRCWPRLEFRAL